MKKAMMWIVFMLVLSGWVAFAFLYALNQRERGMMKTSIEELESEIISYQHMTRYVDESAKNIEEMIVTLEKLKENLDELKRKMEKGVQNESSQDRE